MGLSPAGKLRKFGGQRLRNNAYGPKCGDNRRKYANNNNNNDDDDDNNNNNNYYYYK